MKITIDTVSKIIKLQELVNLDELIAYLKELNIDFTEYSLMGTETIINYWSYPVNPCPSYPPYYDAYKWIVTGRTSNSLSNSGGESTTQYNKNTSSTPTTL